MGIVIDIGEDQTVSAKKLILRALSRLGVTTPTEQPSSEDAQYAFDGLNEMLSQWAVQGLLIPSIQKLELTLTAGQGSYSIGFDGDIEVVPRPVSIEQGLTVTISGLDFVVYPMTEGEYAGIPYKATQGRPERFYYSTSTPGTIEFYPVPDAPYVVQVPVGKPLAYFAEYDQEITVPSGVEAALSWSLAEYLMPDYGRDIRSVISMAGRLRRQVKRRMVNNRFWAAPDSKFNILYGDAR